MRAVWSLWTLPQRSGRRVAWLSDREHLLSWVLSVETARWHYPDTALYTDDEGARLLVDRLALPFVHVSTALNQLKREDPDWWMLGKLLAYRLQERPFVHIDSDVYLWNPLPQFVKVAPVFAQNPEDASNDPWYDSDICERTIRSLGDGAIPIEWNWYRRSGLPQRAASCGILGGNDPALLHNYASVVIRLLTSRRNRVAFNSLPDKRLYNPFFEQYLLCAVARYHGSSVAYLFDSFSQAAECAAEAGYTHLISGAKLNPEIARRLEARVARDYPESYERCLRAPMP